MKLLLLLFYYYYYYFVNVFTSIYTVLSVICFVAVDTRHINNKEFNLIIIIIIILTSNIYTGRTEYF
jgi:hypothetical protein